MIAESLKISAANSVCSPGVESTDAESETQTEGNDVPEGGADNDKDAVNAMVGHCDWNNAQHLPELLWAVTGDLKKVDKIVKILNS